MNKEDLRTILMFFPIWLNKKIADMYATNNNRFYKVFVVEWKILILSVNDLKNRKLTNERVQKKFGHKFIKRSNIIDIDRYLVYTAKPRNIIV